VISTFTRLTFDKESFVQHRFLVTGLPLIIIAGVAAMVKVFGLWSVATLYLYWQWFHYTRQSYGIAQAYRGKAKGAVAENGLPFKLMFYLLPVWGILHRSAQDPSVFLGMPIKVVPVPSLVANAVGVAAVLSLLWWVSIKVVSYRHAQLPIAHTLFMLSHFGIFLAGYVLIKNIDHGWLVLNIWHNAQYVLFVWLYNNNRFKDKVTETHWFLSVLSQRKNMVLYFATCIAISTALYLGLRQAITSATATALPVMVVAYQIINFHHYVVDAVIWRRKKAKTAPLNATLAAGR
jgi:hypothetical protein